MQTLLGIVAIVIGLVVAIKLLLFLMHVVGVLIWVAAMIIWIAALAHIVFTPFSNLGTKIIWFAVVFFTYVFGAIAYFLFGRPRGVVRTYM